MRHKRRASLSQDLYCSSALFPTLVLSGLTATRFALVGLCAALLIGPLGLILLLLLAATLLAGILSVLRVLTLLLNH